MPHKFNCYYCKQLVQALLYHRDAGVSPSDVGVLHFVQLYFQMAERRSGGSDASDAVYYATLIPELGLGLSRLLHHLHTW